MRLPRSLAILAVIPFFFLTVADAAADKMDEATQKEINSYVSYVTKYYQKPNPSGALAQFMRIDWGPFLLKMNISKRQNFNQVAATFYAQIVRMNPQLALPLAKQAAAGGMKYHLAVLGRSIAISGAADRQAALDILQQAYDGAPGSSPFGEMTTEAVFTSLKASKTVDDLTRPILVPFDLDLMWAAFYASGNPAFVNKIGSLLQAWLPPDRFKTRLNYLKPKAELQEGPERGELRLLITAQAAAASLRANARTHPVVLQALDNLSLDRNSRAGKVAKQIMQSLQ